MNDEVACVESVEISRNRRGIDTTVDTLLGCEELRCLRCDREVLRRESVRSAAPGRIRTYDLRLRRPRWFAQAQAVLDGSPLQRVLWTPWEDAAPTGELPTAEALVGPFPAPGESVASRDIAIPHARLTAASTRDAGPLPEDRADLSRSATVPSRRPCDVEMRLQSFYYETDDTCVDEYGVAHNCASALDYNIMKLLQANVVVVASANNQSQNRCVDTPTRHAQTPARAGYGGIYDVPSDLTKRLVITVGGTNISDQRHTCPSLTCGSTGTGSNFGPCVDIYAPADRVQVAHFASPWYRDRTNQAVASGTSFAAPIVSGIAARLLQKYPTKNVREIWDVIRNSASTLPVNFDADGSAANDRLAFISKFN